MQVRRLDHVNIQTTQLEKMMAWYEEMLGLRTGPRPAFPFPGAWLYADGNAVIHLVGHDGTPAVGSEQNLKLEHFALTATGQNTFEAKLNERKHPYKRLELEGVGLVQFHLRDPDGNHVHIDFAVNDQTRSDMREEDSLSKDPIKHLKEVEQRLLWLSHWMIHNANHLRPKEDGIKTGGHFGPVRGCGRLGKRNSDGFAKN